MVTAVIASGALVVLVWEMLRDRPENGHPLWLRVGRFVPFAVVAFLSLYVAARAPRGRKAFQLDLSISGEDLLRSLSKLPHLRSIAVILLLAAVAFGTRHLLRAFVATMLVGVGWELAQTTVVGHHARIADLAPNLVAAVVTVLALVALRALCDRITPWPSSPPADRS